jgi:hypothetical protein
MWAATGHTLFTQQIHFEVDLSIRWTGMIIEMLVYAC